MKKKIRLIVQKYGGTSVADAQRMKNVARCIIRTPAEHLVVVVSAPGDTTDDLIARAHEVTGSPDERELDVLLATGEQQSVALMAMTIRSMGRQAISLAGQQIGIITDDIHTKARIVKIDTGNIRKALKSGQIVVVAGFQGVAQDEEITTLGRGGSDLTAVALAAELKADVCELYKDVDGIFTANPRIVSDARKLERISYDEMLEMSSAGSEVVNSRSVEYAKKYRVPIHVRSSFHEGAGTMIVEEAKEMEKLLVSGVTYNKNEAKITILEVPDRPGIAAKLFRSVADANISVDMIVQDVSEKGVTNISFTVNKSDLKKALAAVNKAVPEIKAGGRVTSDENIAKVSVVGVGMRSHSGVAAEMFEALAAKGINIEMISTSEIKISCIIRAEQTEEAVKTLHSKFKLGKVPVTDENR